MTSRFPPFQHFGWNAKINDQKVRQFFLGAEEKNDNTKKKTMININILMDFLVYKASLVRYCSCHSNIKSIYIRHILFMLADKDTLRFSHETYNNVPEVIVLNFSFCVPVWV